MAICFKLSTYGLSALMIAWLVAYGYSDDCPSGYDEEVSYGAEIKIPPSTRVMVSYGYGGDFVLTPVETTNSIPAGSKTITCNERLGYMSSTFKYASVGDESKAKCCQKKEWPRNLVTTDSATWKKLRTKSDAFASMPAHNLAHWVRLTGSSNQLHVYAASTSDQVYCDARNFAESDHSAKKEYKPHCEYGEKAYIEEVGTLVRCASKNGFCRMQYKNIPVWIAYGNAETGDLRFKLVISKSGIFSCAAFYQVNRLEVTNGGSEHCYFAPNPSDMEVFFGRWKLRGYCGFCQRFSYVLTVGTSTEISRTATETTGTSANFHPSIMGAALFDLGVSASSSISVSRSFEKSVSQSFTFQCQASEPAAQFVYQRELDFYQRDVEGKYRHLQSRLPFAKCHSDRSLPPKCGAGECNDEACQTCKPSTMEKPDVHLEHSANSVLLFH